MQNVIVVNHPLVQHKLGIMRQKDISIADFRRLAGEVGSMLTYAATADLPLADKEIECWSGKITVKEIAGPKFTIVPILRAGLGMMEGVVANCPGARISVVGFYRNEKTLKPVHYFDKIVKDVDQRTAIIVDPMLATGGSIIATIDLLKSRGCKSIKAIVLIAVKEGIEAIHKVHPDVQIICAAIDPVLNEHGYILPGLGDAGDKIFGTK